MDFTFTDEQVGLRDAVRRLGEQHAATDDRGALWRVVTQQLGLTAIGIAESSGGAGGGFVDAGVVIEEAGRTLLPAPLTTALVAGAVLDRAGGAGAGLAAAIAAGETVAVVAPAREVRAAGGTVSGRIPHVLDGDVADVVLVAGADGLWAVDASAAQVTSRPTLDASRGQADLLLDAAPATRLGDGEAAQAAVDLMRVALSLEAVGAARHCLALTVDHLKTREQFGRPIGSFQALQHRAADLVVMLEAAASTAYYAAWAAEQASAELASAELAVVAPAAKSLCGEAAWRVAAETIQMHGGIGFTWEHPAHRYFKRITTTRLLLGDAREQRRLVAERAGLAVERPSQRLGTLGLVTPQ